MKKHPFHVHALTPRGFRKTTFWAIFMAIVIVVSASALARASKNFSAALTDKPDVAIYILLKDQNLGSTTLLRESEDGLERDYLADTNEGPKLVRLKKGETEWYVALTEALKQ